MGARHEEHIDGLIVHFLFDETSRQENMRLQAWLIASEENRRYFNGIRDTYLATLTLRKITFDRVSYRDMRVANDPSFRIDHSHSSAPKKKLLRHWATISAASAIIAALFIGLLGGPERITTAIAFDSEPRMIEFMVNNGTTAITTLPDGSKIWVNAGSRLCYSTDYNTENRVVSLEGEAFFDVQTNSSKPFVVKARDVEIVATGTSFNVSAYSSDKSVIATLIHGEITMTGRNIGQPILLKPNHTVEYFTDRHAHAEPVGEGDISVSISSSHNISLIPTTPAIRIEGDTEAMVCWREDRWIVDGERLETFIPKLERRYNVSIYMTNREIENYRFNGSFEGETIEEVMKILRRALPLSYKIDKGNIFLFTDKDMQPVFNSARKNPL